jgi:putative GTP pyrophosphokinase
VTTNVDQILEAYTSCRDRYDAFAKRVSDLLESLIADAGIRILPAESRGKTVESLAGKLSRPDKSYAKLSDIPDLAGVRVIAFYQDDCVSIAELVKKEFTVIEEELAHQQEKLGSDKFGYISAHYVVKLDKRRAKLVEWRANSDLQCEIQIRTVIQHAWSVVSHELQYKVEQLIPSELQRRLNRIAGLFELADEEFIGIRKQRQRIDESISKKIEEKKTVDISISSVRLFVEQWWKDNNGMTKVRDAGFNLSGEDGGESLRSVYNISLKYGVNTIAQLRRLCGTIDEDYLRKQREASSSQLWSVSEMFVLQLHLIRALSERVQVTDMTTEGWSEPVATRVLQVARESKGNKARKSSPRKRK